MRRLFLTETKIDDAGLGHLKGMKSLSLLGISGTKVSDTGLVHLHGLTGLQNLFCLDTSVTEAGGKKLQKAVPGCEITR